MVKARVCAMNSLRKGTWSPEEDQKLIDYVNRYGIWNWTHMPKPAGLLRSGKSCRLRWLNYLKPGVKRGNFSQEEEEIIFKLHEELGNRWSTIASRLPGRTDNEVKNYWHTRLKKRSQNKPVLTRKATIENNKNNRSEHFSSVSSQLSTEDFSSSSSETIGEIYEIQTKYESVASSETNGRQLRSSMERTFPILESFDMVEGYGTTDLGFMMPTSPGVISEEEIQNLLEQTLPMEELDMVEGLGATDSEFMASKSEFGFSDELLLGLSEQPLPMEACLDMVEGYGAADSEFILSTSHEYRGLQEDTYPRTSYYDGGNDFWTSFLMEDDGI